MLVSADRSASSYRIVLNNSSDASELMSDLSYLVDAPAGQLTFDFTHMAAPLTQEARDEYLPGNFGYQPTRQLVEVVAVIASCASKDAHFPHSLASRLPHPDSRVGDFLARMRLGDLLTQLGVPIEQVSPANTEFGNDDITRQNLIPLTCVTAPPDFTQLLQMRDQIALVFRHALAGTSDLAESFTSIVHEAVDNLIEYGQGGIIGGLFYPRVGEVEISLVNRYGGFGGDSPAEKLDALIDACSGKSQRSTGGGNGIAELSRLAMTCFGTLVLSNGGATLHLLPDGSVTATTDETGLPTPGAAVTILLQLLPAERSSSLKDYERVLQASLTAHRN